MQLAYQFPEHCERLVLVSSGGLGRAMEVQVLSLLGDFRAQADWGAIAAEHHSGNAASTALGREDHAFHGGSP